MKLFHPIYLLLFLLFTPFNLLASNENICQEAANAYANKDYVTANKYYNQQLAALKQTKDASANDFFTTYYNLGNCNFRLNKYGQAMLYYRRALLLRPSDKATSHNIEIVQSRITDSFDAPAEMFFVTWWKRFVNYASLSTWRTIGLLLTLLTLALFYGFRMANRITIKRRLLYGTITCCILLLSAEGIAATQYFSNRNKQEAVVMEPMNTYDAPSSTAKNNKVLHEGTTVRIVDAIAPNWIKVALPDNSIVWVVKNKVVMVEPA